jgi:MOSC domain-containing protein YiiM
MPKTFPTTPLLSLHLGQIEAYGPEGQPSAIRKQPVPGPVIAITTGLIGDHQADLRNHGGPDKAIHHYPFDHYAAWRRDLPERADRFEAAGAFGENLSTLGLTEANVCLGDVFRVGNAAIQVSQGRQPCWKLNTRFDQADMVARVRESGRTGWYYRVVQSGEIMPGDPFELVQRILPDWPLTRLWQVLFHAPVDREALAELSRLDLLAESWRSRAAKRIAEGG